MLTKRQIPIISPSAGNPPHPSHQFAREEQLLADRSTDQISCLGRHVGFEPMTTVITVGFLQWSRETEKSLVLIRFLPGFYQGLLKNIDRTEVYGCK